MNSSPERPDDFAAGAEAPRAVTELLLLPDGRVFAHNLTPAMAAILAALNPADESMRERSRRRRWITTRSGGIHGGATPMTAGKQDTKSLPCD